MNFIRPLHFLSRRMPIEFPSISPLIKELSNLILPAQCISCRELISSSSTGLCSACWKEMNFIARPYCNCCGGPFEFDLDEALVCGACLRDPPQFDACRSVFVYDEKSRDLILKFKHGNGLYLAPLFAEWLKGVSNDFISPEILVIPVPLHWTRLFARMYNQAAILARLFARLTDAYYLPLALKRFRRTPSQGGLNRKKREKNVSRCFVVNPAYQGIIRNKSVLLIDDVLTTGATLNACAGVLRQAGAKEIKALTLARVLTTY